MGRKIGLNDVAQAAGVSTATVDRVLNGRGGVRADKEERILAAAKALGIDRALSLRPARTLRIGLLLQPPKNPFHAALREGFDRAARMYGALNIQLMVQHLDPRAPAATAARIAELAGRRDGLIICAAEHPALDAALQGFAARAPVLTVATDMAASGRAAYVGPDDLQAGRVAGELMGLFLRPAGGRVLMLRGLRENAGQRAREQGFRAVCAERFPSVALTLVLETGEDPEEAGRLVEVAFRQNPGLAGIYHSSAGAPFVVAALERLGRAADTVIISHELTPNRQALLRARKLSAVIDQKPHLEARLAVETMARLLGRLPGEAGSQTTGIQIFLAENA